MAYASGCEARGLQAMPMEQYPAALTKLCRKLRIQVESEEEGVFLKGVALRSIKAIMQDLESEEENSERTSALTQYLFTEDRYTDARCRVQQAPRRPSR